MEKFNKIQKENLPKDFERLASALFDILEENKREESTIKDLGTYELTTSKNQCLTIKALMCDFREWNVDKYIAPIEEQELYPNVTFKQILSLIALDKETTKIVGIRIMDIGENPMSFFARGNINVKDKGKGIASALDTLLNEILEKYSNTEGKQVKWIIENNNLFKLQKLTLELQNNHSPEVLAELRKKVAIQQKEQEAWQKLYGINGRFNFNFKENAPFFSSKIILPRDDKRLEKSELDELEYQRIIDKLKEIR